ERLVVLLVEVTRRSDAPPDRLHPSGMSWLGGANKVIDRKVQQPDQIPELRGILIHERRHTLACRRRGRGVLLTVLVGAGQKPHLEAAEAVETRQHIGNDLLVRVPDVRAGVDVVDGRRDVVALLVHRHHRGKQCTPRPRDERCLSWYHPRSRERRASFRIQATPGLLSLPGLPSLPSLKEPGILDCEDWVDCVDSGDSALADTLALSRGPAGKPYCVIGDSSLVIRRMTLGNPKRVTNHDLGLRL